MEKGKKTAKTRNKPKKKRVLTLEDMAHFVIYRELDKMRVLFPYEKATRICNELRQAVNYRTPKQ